MSDQDPADRLDPSVRELTYRLMGMAPDAPSFPQEAAMTVPETKQRRPMFVWATAVAAVVLLVGLPLFLFRGGDTAPDDVAATLASGPTTTVVGEPTTTIPGGTTVPVPATVDAEFSVYLFSDSLTTAGGDPALVPVHWRAAPLEGASLWQEAMRVLFSSSSKIAGYTTALPVPFDQGSVRLDSGVLTIDLPAEFESGGGTMAMTTRLAQVVFTATQFNGVDSVLFMIGGEVVDVFSSEGLILDGPQTREDYYDILPFIFLDTPAINLIAPSPVHITGIANVFEATVLYEIVDGNGNLLNSGFTTASCGTGCWGDFSVDVPYDVPQETTGEIVVYEESARDGSRVNELRYPMTLVPGNDGPVPSTTIPPESSTPTSLPGEAFDIGPLAGDVVGVVGVAHDDVLFVRDGPGVGYEPFVELDPLADDLVATGRHRLLESSIWTEITAEEFTGWVNSRFIGFLGGVDDLTSFAVDQLGGIPEAETMLDLGEMVAAVFGSTDEGGSRIEMSVAPTVGDLGEVTFDVVGLADDAQLGWRLHIFGQPTEGGEGFSLMSVEATALCGRGVTEDGLCV